MKHETLRVAELPFDPEPDYSVKWTRPPNDWFATVSTASERYPEDFVGDFVTFTATDPCEAPHTSLVEALGMLVIREYPAPDYANAYEAIQDRSVFNGEIRGKFEYFPHLFQAEFPEGSQYPTFREVKKEGNAFVHGIRTARGNLRQEADQ